VGDLLATRPTDEVQGVAAPGKSVGTAGACNTTDTLTPVLPSRTGPVPDAALVPALRSAAMGMSPRDRLLRGTCVGMA